MSRDALVVGINTYNYDRLTKLAAPGQDAEAIAQLLENSAEFKVKRLPAVKDKQNNTIRVGQTTKVSLTQLEEAIAQLFKPEGRNIPDTALLFENAIAFWFWKVCLRIAIAFRRVWKCDRLS